MQLMLLAFVDVALCVNIAIVICMCLSLYVMLVLAIYLLLLCYVQMLLALLEKNLVADNTLSRFFLHTQALVYHNKWIVPFDHNV